MIPSVENLVASLIGMRASANHPITCLNPDPYFIVKEARLESDGRVSVRGEKTMWFGEGIVHVFPSAPTDQKESEQSAVTGEHCP